MNAETAVYKRQRMLVGLAAVFLGFSLLASAQTPAWLDPQNRGDQASDAMSEHLSARYTVESASVKISEREGGATVRSLVASGDFTPVAAVVPDPGDRGKERALARAFLDAEAAALLGLAPADVRVARVSKGMPGDVAQTVISHRVYVGDLPLRGARVQLALDGDGRIRRVSAELPVVPDALRQATLRPTLDEQSVLRLVQADIEADARSANAPYAVRRYASDTARRPTQVEKLAVPTPPYVIWEVRSIWRYDIDAFTGKILRKTPGWADAR